MEISKSIRQLGVALVLSSASCVSAKPIFPPSPQDYNCPPGTPVVTGTFIYESDRFHPSPMGYQAGLVEIITDPVGVAISINDDYIGESPLRVFAVQADYTKKDDNTEHRFGQLEVDATPKGNTDENGKPLYERSKRIGGIGGIERRILLNLYQPDPMRKHR